jgi:hypothetical protein
MPGVAVLISSLRFKRRKLGGFIKLNRNIATTTTNIHGYLGALLLQDSRQ